MLGNSGKPGGSVQRNNKPVVRIDLLVADDADANPVNPIQVGSPAWYTWLVDHQGFIYEGVAGHFTARRELRRGIGYWYGYRRRDGKLSKIYLGKSKELTQESLEQASALLARRMPYKQLLGNGNHGLITSAPNIQAHEIAPRVETVELPYVPLTKVKPPVLPQSLIPRPRITQRINPPVTFICAPSGFGKSTVLNEWRQSCGRQVGWVALDAQDNQPLHFWSAVVTAFQTIIPGFGESWLPQLRTSSPSALSEIVVNLTDEIIRVTDAPNASPGIGLVLDNYHTIQNTEIHTSLQTWLDHMPPKLKLVIASHTKPPLALGYLRAKGMVAELGADDLRFTLEQGIEFLRQHTAGEQLVYRDMQALVKRTGGWITGLVLATHALTQQGDHSRFVETFTGSHTLLREYFTENVLHRQPPEVQTFLLKTSILKHLTGALCDAVTGQSGGAEMLAQLCEQSLFLERLERPGWFRYHEMFAEMLHAKLQEQYHTEVPRLHRRAAKWYRAQASPSEVIHHLLLSKAWGEAAALIEDLALNELEKFGEDSRLWRWLQQLPETMIQQHKTLLVVYIQLARFVLPPQEVDNFLSRTEMSISSMPASEKTSALRYTLTEIKRIRRLWATDHQVVLRFHTNREQDAVGQMLDGILQCHRDSRVDLIKAEVKANEVYEAAKARGHLYSILLAGGACANLAYSQGHLRRSEQVANKVLQHTTELHNKLPEPASIALAALSGVYYERNQTVQALQLLERAIEVDPNPISTNGSTIMTILRAKIQSIQGDGDTAFDTIQVIRELYFPHPSNIWLDQDLIAYQALFRLHQGELISAERHLGGGWEIDQHPFSAFVRASILVEQNRNVAAEEILCHLLNQYPHSFYWVPILRVRAMLSTALFKQKKMNQARQVMAEAARIAAPEFFVRPFLSSDPQIASLLSLVLHTENLNPGTRSFLKGTLTTLGYTDGLQEDSSQDEPMSLAIAASISPREQEILRSLSIGLSNREIALRYSISPSTVKTHLENIFRKLDVNNRMQATAKAQALKLI
jgi:LuxR family maltose regulon positive regulatory protein